jgi:hypothetical protein
MQGDASEFRRRALTCAQLALVSPIPATRKAYAKLAASWLTLATDVERGPQRNGKARGKSNPVRRRAA